MPRLTLYLYKASSLTYILFLFIKYDKKIHIFIRHICNIFLRNERIIYKLCVCAGICQTGIMIIMSTLMFQLSKNTAYSIGSNNIKRKNLLYFRTEQLLDELLFALLTCVMCVSVCLVLVLTSRRVHD